MINLSSESSEIIADWIETLAICSEGKPLAIQQIQEASLNIVSVESNLISFAFNNLIQRKEIFKENYPFLVESNYIVFKSTIEASLYSKLILMSPKNALRQLNDGWHQDNIPKAFEIIVEQCLLNFFGDKTKTVNFGYPSALGRPPEFSDAVKWLCEKINIKVGNAYRPPRKKDGGVDIFVWRNFNDNKSGLPLLLVQCTIGEDYINKIGDVDARLWSSWLATDIDPLIAVAFPGTVVKDNIWDEITIRGLLLDRGRLIELSQGKEVTIPVEMLSIFKSMIEKFKTHYL